MRVWPGPAFARLNGHALSPALDAWWSDYSARTPAEAMRPADLPADLVALLYLRSGGSLEIGAVGRELLFGGEAAR